VGQAPTEYDVSFLVIKRPDESLSAEDLAQIAVIVDRSIEIFNGQTRGLAAVINKTAGEPPPGGTSGGDTTGSSSTTTDSGGSGTSAGSMTSDGSAGGSTAQPDTDTDDAAAAGGASKGDDGCACAAGSTPHGVTAWLVLLLALGARRRREATA
jgi:MYXO-CTERM domain-containing protein